MSKRQDEPLLNGPIRRWIANRQKPRYTIVVEHPELVAMFLTFPLSYPLFVVDWQREKIIGFKFKDLLRENKEMWNLAVES